MLYCNNVREKYSPLLKWDDYEAYELMVQECNGKVMLI